MGSPDSPLLSSVRHKDETTFTIEGPGKDKEKYWLAISDKQFTELAIASEQNLKDLYDKF